MNTALTTLHAQLQVESNMVGLLFVSWYHWHIQTHIHTQTHIQTHTYIHTDTYTDIHIHTEAYRHTHIHRRTQTHIHTDTYIQRHTDTHTYTDTHRHIYRQTHTYRDIQTHTHTQTHRDRYTDTHTHTCRFLSGCEEVENRTLQLFEPRNFPQPRNTTLLHAITRMLEHTPTQCLHTRLPHTCKLLMERGFS